MPIPILKSKVFPRSLEESNLSPLLASLGRFVNRSSVVHVQIIANLDGIGLVALLGTLVHCDGEFSRGSGDTGKSGKAQESCSSLHDDDVIAVAVV